jgi:hypothetical protein
MRNHYALLGRTVGVLLMLLIAPISASRNFPVSQLLNHNRRGDAAQPLTPSTTGRWRSRETTKIDLRTTRRTPSNTASQLTIRGGANSIIVSGINDYIGATKFRCWMALLVAMVFDIGATTMLAIATKEKSSPKLAAAMVIYIVR